VDGVAVATVVVVTGTTSFLVARGLVGTVVLHLSASK
jgi:hypothetical protein